MSRKFKPNKARKLILGSPLGHKYTFTPHVEVKALYNDWFYEEDEKWMVTLCTKAGGELLVEVDAPRDIAIDSITKLTEHDILGTEPDIEAHPIIVNQEKQNEEALIALSGMDARNAAREAAGEFKEKVFNVIEEALDEESIKSEEEVISPDKEVNPITESEVVEVKPEIIIEELSEKYSEEVENFLIVVDKYSELTDELLAKKLYASFRKANLVQMCSDLKLNQEGTNKELIALLLEELTEDSEDLE